MYIETEADLGFTYDDWQDLYEYLSQDEVVKYRPTMFTVKAENRGNEFEKMTLFAVCLKEVKGQGNIYFQQGPKVYDMGNWLCFNSLS